jgi:hypothetical protein
LAEITTVSVDLNSFFLIIAYANLL